MIEQRVERGDVTVDSDPPVRKLLAQRRRVGAQLDQHGTFERGDSVRFTMESHRRGDRPVRHHHGPVPGERRIATETEMHGRLRAADFLRSQPDGDCVEQLRLGPRLLGRPRTARPQRPEEPLGQVGDAQAYSTRTRVAGIASSLASGIGSPDTSHSP